MDKRFLAFAATGVLTLVLLAASVAVWLNDDGSSTEPETEQVDRGRQLFQTKGCVGCHNARGVYGPQIGPDLSFLPSQAGDRIEGKSAEEYVRESIVAPDAFIVPGSNINVQMPRLQMTADEVEALVAFLLSQPES